MNNEENYYFQQLGLNLNATEKEIKRAYATCLKKINTTSQANEFGKLRAEYEWALKLLDQNQEVQILGKIQQENLFHQTLNVGSDVINDKELTEPETHSIEQLKERLKEKINETITASYLFSAGASSALIQSFNQELFEEINKTYSVKQVFVEELLKVYLTKDELLSIEEKVNFENFLIENLYDRIYQNNNLIVLLAAKKIFAWDQSLKIRVNNDSVDYVDNLLLHLSFLKEDAYKYYPFIAQNPNPKDSKKALEFYQTLERINQNLADFCMPAAHLNLWKISFEKRNIFVKTKDMCRTIVFIIRKIKFEPHHLFYLILFLMFGFIFII